jgi:hypothetical protein
MAGFIGGQIKGKPSSTKARIEVPGEPDTNVTKDVGEDYWSYSRTVAAGDHDVTARDTTPGAGGNNQTKPVTVPDWQFVRLDFDIS